MRQIYGKTESIQSKGIHASIEIELKKIGITYTKDKDSPHALKISEGKEDNEFIVTKF